MPVPSEVTLEGSFTLSLSDAGSRSLFSGGTYSTSAQGSEVESDSSSFTEDTLSMITTPWVTESLDIQTISFTNGTGLSSAFISWPSSTGTLLSTSSLLPGSSTTFGIQSPQVNTDDGTTITILCGGGSVSSSGSIRPALRSTSRFPSETFSSWTLETFTSSGWTSECKTVHAKYPWSPSTVRSGSETYPSSSHSFVSRKGSRVTLVASTPDSRSRQEQGHVTPIHYMGLANKPEKMELQWTLDKLKSMMQIYDLPIYDALKSIVAV